MSFPDEETRIWAKKKYGGSGGGLPVVELTTKANIFSTDAVDVSEAENAALNAAWETNLPCIISLGVEGMEDILSFVFTRRSIPGPDHKCHSGLYFHSFVGLMNVNIENNNGDRWHIFVDIISTGA